MYLIKLCIETQKTTCSRDYRTEHPIAEKNYYCPYITESRWYDLERNLEFKTNSIPRIDEGLLKICNEDMVYEIL